MFDKLKKLFAKKVTEEKPKPKKDTRPKKEPELSPKEIANKANEPFIHVVKMDIDPRDVNNGSFELDWNAKFVVNLIKFGYKIRDDDTEQQIVERWFQTVCRNIALELYEQTQADPTNRDLRPISTRDLGNGRTEVS